MIFTKTYSTVVQNILSESKAHLTSFPCAFVFSFFAIIEIIRITNPELIVRTESLKMDGIKRCLALGVCSVSDRLLSQPLGMSRGVSE